MNSDRIGPKEHRVGWADPGKQTIPKAWQGKSHAQLAQAVFEYTRDTLAAFGQAGVLPEMVRCR